MNLEIFVSEKDLCLILLGTVGTTNLELHGLFSVNLVAGSKDLSLYHVTVT